MKRMLIISALLLLGSSCQGQKTPARMNYSIEEILEQSVYPEDAIMELDSIINTKSNYGGDISALTEGEKVILFVENLEREVNNGGFDQFFFNSSGNYAHETLDALKRIGANEIAGLLAKAIAVWPDATVPNNETLRREQHERISDHKRAIWNACDEVFYQSKEYLAELLVDYINAHLDEFKP